MTRIALVALFVLSIASPAMASEAEAATGGLSSRVVEIFLAVTVLSLAPGIAMMATCLPLIVIVLSILRQGAGLQQSPPNMMIMGVALFLTWFVMEPVFADAWTSGVRPMLDGAIEQKEGLGRAAEPFAEFMRARVDEGTLATLADARGDTATLRGEEPPLSLLAPAFALSEIQRAFQIGFVVLLPFLVIDLLIASILMAMGMMMVPPAAVALPFKLAFFVLTNSWVAVSAALVRSYA
jgi:flagellar biosynthetic protein FliP